ncbi:MAG: L,D-transpeptidase [Solirubrobacterales bacterium]
MARGRLRVVTGVVVAVAATGVAAAPTAAVGQPPVVKPTQELAKLLRPHKVISRSQAGAQTAGTVQASGPITGGQTVLPVIGRASTTDGGHWLRVMLPGRPNGRKGWITKRATVSARTSWHVVVKTSSRQVLVYRTGHLVESFAAIVGTPSTPTPRGQFFVEESVRMPPGSPGWPFALALSARSNVLQEFEGGPGQIGIHGVANIGGELGTAVSHGCVRVADQSSVWLAAHIAPGVPVTITR